MFTITIPNPDEEEFYELDHSTAVEFLDFLGVIGMEACRDAEDFGQVHYASNAGTISIEFHEDSRV